MRRICPPLVAIGLLLTSSQQARAAPSLGYLDVAYALPFHVAFRSFEQNGVRTNQTEFLRSGSALGLSAMSAGLGAGYQGLNVQLDFRNALNLTTGALTIGWRQRWTLGPAELWGRLGGGPVLAFDFGQTTGQAVTTTGGIATDFEAGVSWFFVPWLALEGKGVATPTYSWPTNFSLDIALNLGLRAAI